MPDPQPQRLTQDHLDVLQSAKPVWPHHQHFLDEIYAAIAPEIQAAHSWLVDIFESGNSKTGVRNGLRFDTPEHAAQWLSDLSLRWSAFDHGTVVPSTELPTHTIIDNKLTRLEETS